MLTHTLEGTWEEIEAHAEDLRGHRVRLMVLDALPIEANGEENDEAEPLTLDKVLAGRIGRVDFLPDDLGERAEEYFGEIIEEKYRTGNL